MDAASARIHYLHDLSRAASISAAFARDVTSYRVIALEALSVEHRDCSHVAREKCDYALSSIAPRYIATMHEMLADLRELHAAASQS